MMWRPDEVHVHHQLQQRMVIAAMAGLGGSEVGSLGIKFCGGLFRRVWLLEQCLAWGGEQRLRLRLTIAAYPGVLSPLLSSNCIASRVMVLQNRHCRRCTLFKGSLQTPVS